MEFRDQMIEQMVETLFIEHQRTGRPVDVPKIVFINGKRYDVAFHLGLPP